jgi:DNA modification methylase
MLKPYYQSDRVTLYHGDCLEILPQLEAGSCDMIFTDPPYGHNNNNGDLIHRVELACPSRAKQGNEGILDDARPIANDGEEANGLFKLVLPEFRRLLQPGCCCCCCCGGGGGPDPQFARWSMWLDEAIGFKQMVVWDKGPMGMGWHYRRSYECVLVAEKPGAACRWFDTSGKVENIIRKINKIIPRADDHPTPKPVALAMYFIGLHTQPGHVVLDAFTGGGSTALACVKTNRRFIGVELSEAYCEMTAKRIQAAEAQGMLDLEVA